MIELVNQEIIEFEKVPYLDRTLSSLFRDTTYSNFFTESYENFENLSFQRIIETSSISPQLKKSISDEVSITDLTITSDKIKFSTDKPNELHLIKISYFPNWEIVNGEGPYRISPSFMAVVPYSENVEINFVKTKLESFSFYIALFSLLLFISLSARKKLNE
jgi:hypothetical protein